MKDWRSTISQCPRLILRTVLFYHETPPVEDLRRLVLTLLLSPRWATTLDCGLQ